MGERNDIVTLELIGVVVAIAAALAAWVAVFPARHQVYIASVAARVETCMELYSLHLRQADADRNHATGEPAPTDVKAQCSRSDREAYSDTSRARCGAHLNQIKAYLAANKGRAIALCLSSASSSGQCAVGDLLDGLAGTSALRTCVAIADGNDRNSPLCGRPDDHDDVGWRKQLSAAGELGAEEPIC
jgi:hypothetical protein